MRAYDDYHAGRLYSVGDARNPIIPKDLHDNSKGVYRSSNYTFESDDEWTAIEKSGHVEAFSTKYMDLSHVQMVFGKEGADEFCDISEKTRVFREHVMMYEKNTARYHLMNGDSIYLKEGVFYHSYGSPVEMKYSGVCEYIKEKTGEVWSWSEDDKKGTALMIAPVSPSEYSVSTCSSSDKS